MNIYKLIILLSYGFVLLVTKHKALSQSCITPPTKPNIIVGYYPAFKLNSKLGIDYNISSSITHLNYIAFSPNDLLNGTGPFQVFQNKLDKFNDLTLYKNKNNLTFKLILSVLLPVNASDFIKFPPLRTGTYLPTDQQTKKFIDDLTNITTNYSFHGIDIEYPYKLPCFQQPTLPQQQINFSTIFVQFLNDVSSRLKPLNKLLTVTAGQYPIDGISPANISFINIQAFHLNINSAYSSAGIDNIQKIFSRWYNYVDKLQLVLGVEFGGVVESVISNNITKDIENQNLTLVSGSNLKFPFAAEIIDDPCKNTSYAYLPWKNLTTFLSPPCYTSASSPWIYGFDNLKTKQSYIYQQYPGVSTQFYYVSYDDFQSLKYKLDFIKENASGIAIADVTRDFDNLMLMNFISGNITPNSPSPENTTPNIGAIVGGTIGAWILINVLLVLILFRRYLKKKQYEGVAQMY
ncbi:22556_t:CDS:2 [Cetraspora pellucida]|uniref:22556_t:CDS:1 n=1 Tax=Cetraspora pellucida TaxID=1433469 RepID=A0A9N9IX70_9GLOM|nr:22556_t:CDS:2 [Cetraspora pellucida]